MSAKIVFEFFATAENGPDLVNELARLVPASMKCRGDTGAPCLQIKGRREDLLSLRSRFLRKHPNAQVCIFEVPADAHPSWAFAYESQFVPSGDGLTFVIPGDAREPPKPPTHDESPRGAQRVDADALSGETNDKRRLEDRARRAARRVGLLVRKSRERAHVPNLDNFGELMLVDGERGYVVGGSRFDMSAEDVLEFCTRGDDGSKKAVGR